MIAKLNDLGKDLGTLGLLALLALGVTAGVHIAFIQPLEREANLLDARVASLPKGLPRAERQTARPPEQAARLYKVLDSGERIDESLARLYGIASACGVELRSADYRLGELKNRFERYEISLPTEGTYGQIRLFLETALRELPSLSLDKVTLRRKNAADTRIDAELILTLHRLHP